jgi:hypothetical protein
MEEEEEEEKKKACIHSTSEEIRAPYMNMKRNTRPWHFAI